MLISDYTAIQVVLCILILFVAFTVGTSIYMLIKSKPHKKEKRVRGEDTGCLTWEFLFKLKRMLKKDPKRAEVSVYIMLYELESASRKQFSGETDYTRHGETLNRLSQEWDYARFYLILQTKHFGVTFDYMEDSKTIETFYSDSYKRWEKFWSNHIETFDTTTWAEFEYAILNGGNITPYLPKKAWNED